MADARVSVLIDLRSRLAGLEQAVGVVGKLVKGLAAGYLGVHTIIAGSRDIIGLGAELNHLAAQTGIAESDLLVLRQAFSDNGVVIEQVGPSVNKLQMQLVQAARTGSGPAAEAMRAMNLSVEDLLELSPSEQFAAVSQGLAGIEDPALRNASAMALFGKQGAKLMPLFQTGGALDDAHASLGAMPEVLERNAVEFERIDTLLGRIPNKSRQLFAGLGDQLGAELLGPLEAVNGWDFTVLGQRLGAFVEVGLQAIRNGRFAEFISLTIEARFEQGISTAQSLWQRVLGVDGGNWWQPLLAGAMTFGVEVAETLLTALETPVAYLSTGMRWAASQARVAWEYVANAISGLFEGILNTLIGGFEGLLNSVLQRVNAITAALPFTDGTQFENVQFGRIEWQQSEPAGAALFDTLYAEQQQGVSQFSRLVQDSLNSNLRESQAIIGLQVSETEEQVSATERLNHLIDDQLQRREQLAAESVSSNAITEATAFNSIFSTEQSTATGIRQNFATTSDQRFSEFQAGTGDDGVSTLDAARAGLQDCATQAGTVAQQVHGQIGGIASSLQQGIGGSIKGLIDGTMTWKDALANIGQTVMTSVIQAIIDMAATWITQQLVMFALGQKLKTADTATTAAKGAVDAAAMAPAATMASIASWGAAAVIGLALVLGAIAMFGGFADGGYTGSGGKHTPAGIVHAGEDVFSQANIALWGDGWPTTTKTPRQRQLKFPS